MARAWENVPAHEWQFRGDCFEVNARRNPGRGLPPHGACNLSSGRTCARVSNKFGPEHPRVAILQELSDESRLVVSEPLGDLKGAWNEVPEAHYGVVQAGQDELLPFTPVAP